MAPIKFEEHLKEKLDQREITPSAGSWDKLNKSLQKADGGKKKFSWWIPSVAAVIVLMICGLLFADLNKNEGVQVVDTTIEEPSEEINQEKNETQAEIASGKQENSIQEAQQETKNNDRKPAKIAAPLSTQKTIASSEKREDQASEKDSFMESVSMQPQLAQNQGNIQVTEELEDILDKVSELKANKGTVSNAEVDALLAEAAIKINSKRNLLNSEKISADALLADVEDEVYESFKEKVFEMVKTGYQKAAVAVSNKLDNNQ